MPNPIVHFEIGCKDRPATAAFYQAIFDWEFEDRPDAVHIKTGSEVGGHIGALGHEPHNYTMFYVGVDNIESTLAEAVKNGGTKLVGPIPIPGGRFAWICRPGREHGRALRGCQGIFVSWAELSNTASVKGL